MTWNSSRNEYINDSEVPFKGLNTYNIKIITSANVAQLPSILIFSVIEGPFSLKWSFTRTFYLVILTVVVPSFNMVVKSIK